MKYVAALTVALVLNASANLLLKVGAKEAQQSGGLFSAGIVGGLLSILRHPALILGLLCFGLNAILYMYALQSPSLKISVAYPVMVGGGYALIAIVASLHPALGETLTVGQKAGVAAVLLGIVLIAASGSSHRGSHGLPATM